MIAAQPLFDERRRLVGAGIGVGRHAVGVQRDFRIEMDRAFGAEAKAVARERKVTRIASVKIFTYRLGNPVADTVAQRVANIEIFPGHAKCHGSLRNVTSALVIGALDTDRSRSISLYNTLTRPRYQPPRCQRGSAARVLARRVARVTRWRRSF